MEKSSRSKYINVTVLNVMIDDLKPNTNYEFSVKLVKGQRDSPWSMVVSNRTWDIPPNAAPRELQVRAVEKDSQIIELSWQPPKQQNAYVTGNFIVMFYAHFNGVIICRLRYFIYDRHQT